MKKSSSTELCICLCIHEFEAESNDQLSIYGFFNLNKSNPTCLQIGSPYTIGLSNNSDNFQITILDKDTNCSLGSFTLLISEVRKLNPLKRKHWVSLINKTNDIYTGNYTTNGMLKPRILISYEITQANPLDFTMESNKDEGNCEECIMFLSPTPINFKPVNILEDSIRNDDLFNGNKIKNDKQCDIKEAKDRYQVFSEIVPKSKFGNMKNETPIEIRKKLKGIKEVNKFNEDLEDCNVLQIDNGSYVGSIRLDTSDYEYSTKLVQDDISDVYKIQISELISENNKLKEKIQELENEIRKLANKYQGDVNKYNESMSSLIKEKFEIGRASCRERVYVLV